MTPLAILKRQLQDARDDATVSLRMSNLRGLQGAMDREYALMIELARLVGGKSRKKVKGG